MSRNKTAMTHELTARQLAERQQAAAIASGRATGKTDSQRERVEWKRRQAIQPAAPRYIEPTLPERINRLRPSERHELGQLLKSMKLRKIIKRTLAEAFWNGQATQIHATQTSDVVTMQRLRSTLQGRESLMSYERALTSFEPVYTHSSYGDGNDSPAVKRVLEQSLLIQR